MFVCSIEIQQPSCLRDVTKTDSDVENILAGVKHILFTYVGLINRFVGFGVIDSDDFVTRAWKFSLINLYQSKWVQMVR